MARVQPPLHEPADRRQHDAVDERQHRQHADRDRKPCGYFDRRRHCPRRCTSLTLAVERRRTPEYCCPEKSPRAVIRRRSARDQTSVPRRRGGVDSRLPRLAIRN